MLETDSGSRMVQCEQAISQGRFEPEKVPRSTQANLSASTMQIDKEEENSCLGGAEAKVRHNVELIKGAENHSTFESSIYELHAPHNGNGFPFLA
jgi:hypothetical protein